MKNLFGLRARVGLLDHLNGAGQNASKIIYIFIYLTIIGTAAGILIVAPSRNYSTIFLLTMNFPPVLIAHFLARRGKVERAAAVLAASLIFINTLVSTNNLGIHSINNIAYPVILIIASFVASRRSMLLLTALSITSLGWLVFGEISGLYQPGQLIQSVPGDFFSTAFAVTITAVLAHWLNTSLNKGMSNLQDEIEERKELSENLRQRESLLQAVTFAAEQFLRSANWRATIDSVLERLGTEFNVSHAYLFEKHTGPDGAILSSMTYEWTRPGLETDLGNPEFQNLPLQAMGFERMYDILDRGEPLVGSTSWLNEFEKEYLRSIGVKSLLEIRVIVNGEQWGTIGFDDVNNEREWSLNEVNVIKLAAGMLGAAVERSLNSEALENELGEKKKLIAELKNRNSEAETLRETTEIVTSTLNISEAIQQILTQLKRVVQYDSASVWLYEDSAARMVGAHGLPHGATSTFPIGFNEPDYPLWESTKPYVLLNDVQEQYTQFQNPPLNYIHGWLAVPLKVRGKFIGFISLDGKQVGQFTDRDAELAVNYANQVSIALEHARLFSDLQNELTERAKLIKELEEKNSELERFTYTVSHDLKSPLVTIAGFLRYLEQDVAANNVERFKSDLTRIDGAVDKMQRLLMELLDLSRIGRMVNPPVEAPFENLVRESLEAVHGRLEATGCRVIIQPDLPTVIGDLPRLSEVIQNLLDNAAKYMGDQTNPQIEIGARGMEDGKPILYVKDNGMGIAPEYHNRIFELFNKLDAKSEGTGVGLALVKRIIEVHGGRIWVESSFGNGSTFYFTLPALAN